MSWNLCLLYFYKRRNYQHEVAAHGQMENISVGAVETPSLQMYEQIREINRCDDTYYSIKASEVAGYLHHEAALVSSENTITGNAC